MNKITSLGETVTFTPAFVKQLIDAHVDEGSRLEELYNEYKGEVDILDRDFDDETLLNAKLPNDYRGEIVDQIMGYLVGQPVVCSYDENDDKVNEQLEDFKKINNIELLDLNTVKMMSICGIAYRLLYLQDAIVYVINCMPWTVIPIWHASGEWLVGAVRYITIFDADGNETYLAECYDDTHVVTYIEENSTFVIHEDTVKHGFDKVPIIPIENNEEMLGDYEKTSGLIDAYDVAMSDAQNEIEEFRQAYQIFTNCKVDATIKEQARRTGAYNIPKNGKVEYLTKDLNPEFLKQHLDRMEENIYRFSKTVNMSDEKFSGDSQSGVARKWKLLTLEFRATIKELKLIEAFRWQFEIIEYVWKATGLSSFNYLDLEYKFTRNIPMELKEAAEVASALKGLVSDQTLLETIPIVNNVKKEIERIEDEREEIDLDDAGELE